MYYYYVYDLQNSLLTLMTRMKSKVKIIKIKCNSLNYLDKNSENSKFLVKMFKYF